MWFVWFALLIDAPTVLLITPFGWSVFWLAALAIMAIQLVGGRGRMWPAQ